MSGIKQLIRSKLSKRPGFWFFQIIGWGIFFIINAYQSLDVLRQYKEMIFILIISNLFAFFLSLFIRSFYKKIFSNSFSIYYVAIIIIVTSVLCGLIWNLFNRILLSPIGNIIKYGGSFKIVIDSMSYLINRSFFLTFPFLAWSSLYMGIKFWIELIEARKTSEKSLLLAQKSQLQMLRYQLNPHFLFNSLNSIQALVYEDPAHADKMITELSEFLRYTIQDKDKLFIPLGEEVKIVEKYLSMEKTRFPDRLDYKISVSDKASEIEVIAFILQPFVENAVKHGLKSSPEKLLVTVIGYAEAHRLYLEIRNNGPWIENKTKKGVGIENVFDRLKTAYPDKYNMHIYKNPDSVCVLVEIYI